MTSEDPLSPRGSGITLIKYSKNHRARTYGKEELGGVSEVAEGGTGDEGSAGSGPGGEGKEEEEEDEEVEERQPTHTVLVPTVPVEVSLWSLGSFRLKVGGGLGLRTRLKVGGAPGLRYWLKLGGGGFWQCLHTQGLPTDHPYHTMRGWPAIPCRAILCGAIPCGAIACVPLPCCVSLCRA